MRAIFSAVRHYVIVLLFCGSAIIAGAGSCTAANSANFNGEDLVSQGDWNTSGRSYGSEGYNLYSSIASAPTYATVTLTGASTYQWAATTTDGRALVAAAHGLTPRIAGCAYGSQFTIDIAVGDGNSHTIALYAMDWESAGRSEQIQVLDGDTQTVLDTENLTSFVNGTYLLWTVSGHVQIIVTSQVGPNAVVSGLFFGTPSATVTGTASFIGTDAVTLGNWQGVYGSDGYLVAGDSASDPTYATTAIAGGTANIWSASTTDGRALQTAENPVDRIAATDYAGQYLIDIACSDSAPHTLAAYVLDWDQLGRDELVEVVDVGTGTVLDTREIAGFALGQYEVWTVTGHVKLRLTDLTGNYAVLSGLFYGTPPSGGSGAATFLGTDSYTQGDWTAAPYGSDGYLLAGAGTSLPSYASITVAGAQLTTWANPTVDTRALLSAPPGVVSRIAAADYAHQFDVDITCTDGEAHAVSAYVVDWDAEGRVELLQLLDGTTGAVLDSRTLSGFQHGTYCSWTISGHVVLRITAQSGTNAVLSGLFFGAATPSASGSATFLTADAITQGAWSTAYGSEGQDILADALNNPSYGALSTDGTAFTWSFPTSDPRALTTVAPLAAGGIASGLYGTEDILDCWCTDANPHQVAMYGLDWDGTGRVEQVQVLDGSTGATLDTQTLSSFSGGTYLAWTVTGHVKIMVTGIAGPNAVVSGVFFGTNAFSGGVNQAPSFTIGPNLGVLPSAGPQTVTGWATQISAGPPSESWQTVAFSVNVDHPEYFTVQPSVGPDGTLTYTPAAAGLATLSVTLQDNGGTANGGVNTSAPQTAQILINATPGPVILTQPYADANPVYDSSVGVHVSVVDPDGSQPIIIWGTTVGNASFSDNGDTTANNTTAYFYQTGPVTLQVTAFDGNGSVSATLPIQVNAAISALIVDNQNIYYVAPNASFQYIAWGLDQFNNLLTSVDGVTWSVDGGGTITSDGVFTAGNTEGGPFDVTVSLGDLNATVQVTIGVPQPIAYDLTATTMKNVPVATTLTAIGYTSDVLTYSIVSPPAHGTLSGFAPNLTYTPATGYLGTDSFQYIAYDDSVGSNVATVAISIYQVVSDQSNAASSPLVAAPPYFPGDLTMQWIESARSGQIWQSAQPGVGVPILAAVGSRYVPTSGGLATLSVTGAPNAPVMFLTMGAGVFVQTSSTYPGQVVAQVVIADANGLAVVQFQAPPGVSRTPVLAASPLASGRVRFVVKGGQ